MRIKSWLKYKNNLMLRIQQNKITKDLVTNWVEINSIK